MKKIILKLLGSPQKDCPIFIGSCLMEKIPALFDIKKYSNIFIITDQNLKPFLINQLRPALPADTAFITLPSGEKGKQIKNIQGIWKEMSNACCDRKSLVINLGGGVILDMGGFAAATYMRGIDFLQIPTTLLSQVDAGIGGKTGINFAGIKNLIGAFQQPIGVIIDIDTLSTLPKREFISGFGEIIKHGAVADKKYFQFVASKKPQEFSQKELEEIIEKSCQIKIAIIEEDPEESGSRKLLNFGHTIGHAIESLSQETKNPLLHGEAVSIGMIAESKISRLLGLLSSNELETLEQSILNAGLPTKILKIPTKKVLEKMNKVFLRIKSDKKNEKGNINWTLLKGIGKAVYDQRVKDSIIRKIL